jgi:RNA polymerase sigma factor (sigma-70 family)
MVVNDQKIKAKNDTFIALWNNVKEGDREAFNALCENHYRMLFNYAFTITNDRELIKDVIQDLFLGLWEKRNTLGDINAMSIYLIKALRNNLLYQLRKNKFNFVNNYFEDEENNLTDYSTIEGSIIKSEIFSENELRVRKALDLLPKRQKEALFLKFFQGKSHEEIANVMDINTQSVYNHLQKAFSTLRTLLAYDWKVSIFILYTVFKELISNP